MQERRRRLTKKNSNQIPQFLVGEVKNYICTDSSEYVYLSPGTYKLQCWGAQGGSSIEQAPDPRGIYAIPIEGGKGGYSEGIFTISQSIIVQINVGGKGSYSYGGYNGGGSTQMRSSTANSAILIYSYFGGGGGASDIRLSNGSLYSRIIVAGGGSGGAFCLLNSVSDYHPMLLSNFTNTNLYHDTGENDSYLLKNGDLWMTTSMQNAYISVNSYQDYNFYIKCKPETIGFRYFFLKNKPVAGSTVSLASSSSSGWITSNRTISGKVPSDATYLFITNINNFALLELYKKGDFDTFTTKSQIGYPGGGIQGKGYSDDTYSFFGTQNRPGNNGSFGEGATALDNNVYNSAGGGGGWYGGGSMSSTFDINSIMCSGGGSGFVNISENAQYRPQGYTGLQLDSGVTYAGNQEFESVEGSTEIGHSGDGHIRITKIS